MPLEIRGGCLPSVSTLLLADTTARMQLEPANIARVQGFSMQLAVVHMLEAKASGVKADVLTFCLPRLSAPGSVL